MVRFMGQESMGTRVGVARVYHDAVSESVRRVMDSNNISGFRTFGKGYLMPLRKSMSRAM